MMGSPDSITGKLIAQYMEWQKANADPRVDGYPLMEDPFTTLSIIALYLTAVFWGPRVMQNQKPYHLATYTYYYNVAQILFCSYYIINVYLMTEVEPDGVYLMCKVFRTEKTPATERIAMFQYINFVARLIELSETIVHILRKKSRLISYLHVIHHVLNVMLAWLTTRFMPGGSASTVCLINFTVHLVMFSYYWAAMQPGTFVHRLSSKFKKYITMFQMLQFVYLLAIVINAHYRPECMENVNGIVAYSTVLVVAANIVLFSNFYIKNYITQCKKSY